jgi:hypothetical protein
VRGKAERFADHYTQATLFWNSQTETEKQHIVNAFRFELSKVQTPAVRERMVSGLMNVARELAEPVAAGLGMRDLPKPMPKVLKRDVAPEVTVSPALSLLSRPGDGSIRTRRVAIVVADGCEGESLVGLADRLTRLGAVVRFLSTTLGSVEPAGGDAIEVDVSLEATPAVLYDAVVLPDGAAAVDALRADGHTWTSSRIRTATASRSSPLEQAIGCSRRAASIERYRVGRPIPDCCLPRMQARWQTSSSRRWRSIGTSREKPIHHGSEHGVDPAAAADTEGRWQRRHDLSRRDPPRAGGQVQGRDRIRQVACEGAVGLATRSNGSR